MGLTFLLAAALWSGSLVDSRCYDSEENNVNRSGATDHDQQFEIRACHPTSHSKSFAVVQSDGQSFRLDAAGNAKAASIVQGIEKKPYVDVIVTGVMSKDTVRVESISIAK